MSWKVDVDIDSRATVPYLFLIYLVPFPRRRPLLFYIGYIREKEIRDRRWYIGDVETFQKRIRS